MENISTKNFMIELLDQWMLDMENNKSKFGKRVVVKETYRVFVKDGVDDNGNDTYNFTWNGIIFDAIDGSKLSDVKITTAGQKGLDHLALERIEAVLTASLSGIYCTPFDTKNVYNTFNREYRYQCDECGEYFGEDIDKFIEHLRTTKHSDGIFKRYPHWSI